MQRYPFRKIAVSILLMAVMPVPAAYASPAPAGEAGQETRAHVANIRAIKAGGDKQTLDRYNKQMDQAWAYFNAHLQQSLPVLRTELSQELKQTRPNPLILLDLGYFVARQEDEDDKALARRALLAIDPAADIIRANQQELFEFAYLAASSQDPELLPFFDRAFVKGSVTAFVPQHVLSLDETLVCVFIYGKYGKAGEQHLRPLLADPAVANRVIEVLIWTGSPDSVPAVREAMLSRRDYDTFVRATTFMMMAGGPEGRTAMLAIDPAKFDAKAREYYRDNRGDIERASYAQQAKQFEGFSGSAHLGDAELKSRLAAMYEHYGKDDNANPMAILNSGLPRQFLADQLVRIRARTFYRLSDEGLDDVKVTNAILNALYYRQH